MANSSTPTRSFSTGMATCRSGRSIGSRTSSSAARRRRIRRRRLMAKDDGGPAFARSAHCDHECANWSDEQDGMSLRDYFAAKAMQSLILEPEKWLLSQVDRSSNIENLCALSFEFADLMIVERAKP